MEQTLVFLTKRFRCHIFCLAYFTDKIVNSIGIGVIREQILQQVQACHADLSR